MKRVLAVDDEPGALMLTRVALERAGFAVTVAHNGGEALKLLDDLGAPDLAIIDVMMPDLDGIALCRRIKTRPEYAALPILIVTARADSYLPQAALDAGAGAFLSKPYRASELIANVWALLDQENAPDQPDSPE